MVPILVLAVFAIEKLGRELHKIPPGIWFNHGVGDLAIAVPVEVLGLIISDVMMPRMDGIQFCKKIKTDISTSHIPVILLTSADERFLQKTINLVKDNISNTELNIEDMGTELGMSRVHLYRKLKALTNQTPSEFVRTIRLKQAAYLLTQNKINISEVAYAVGFSSHQYFTNCFQNYFSMSPTEYSHQNQEGTKVIDIDRLE